MTVSVHFWSRLLTPHTPSTRCPGSWYKLRHLLLRTWEHGALLKAEIPVSRDPHACQRRGHQAPLAPHHGCLCLPPHPHTHRHHSAYVTQGPTHPISEPNTADEDGRLQLAHSTRSRLGAQLQLGWMPSQAASMEGAGVKVCTQAFVSWPSQPLLTDLAGRHQGCVLSSAVVPFTSQAIWVVTTSGHLVKCLKWDFPSAN